MKWVRLTVEYCWYSFLDPGDNGLVFNVIFPIINIHIFYQHFDNLWMGLALAVFGPAGGKVVPSVLVELEPRVVVVCAPAAARAAAMTSAPRCPRLPAAAPI